MFIYLTAKCPNALTEITHKFNLDLNTIKTNDLSTCIDQNLSRLSHVTHIIVDLFGLLDNENELVHSFEKLIQMYESSVVILLADMLENREDTEVLFTRLINKGIYNIVTQSV